MWKVNIPSHHGNVERCLKLSCFKSWCWLSWVTLAIFFCQLFACFYSVKSWRKQNLILTLIIWATVSFLVHTSLAFLLSLYFQPWHLKDLLPLTTGARYIFFFSVLGTIRPINSQQISSLWKKTQLVTSPFWFTLNFSKFFSPRLYA